MKYKATIYRVLTQSIEVEVEAPWYDIPNLTGAPNRLLWVKTAAEDIAAEESDHDWKDEGWEFDSFQAVSVEEE